MTGILAGVPRRGRTRAGTAAMVVTLLVATSATSASADSGGSAEPARLTITSTSGPITGFALQVEGGAPDAPVYVFTPLGGPESTCRVFRGRIEHVGTSRTCTLSVIQVGDATHPDAYSPPTQVTFTGRYPTSFSGLFPDGYVQSADHPLQVGAGWVINAAHASVMDLPAITGNVELTLNGVAQPPLPLSPWSGDGSGVVNVGIRVLPGMPTGHYTAVYTYPGDAFHEPTTTAVRFDYVPNRFLAGRKTPARPHAARLHLGLSSTQG